jgi:putative membrane protein
VPAIAEVAWAQVSGMETTSASWACINRDTVRAMESSAEVSIMKQNRFLLSTCALSAVVLVSPLAFSQNTTSASSSDKKFVHSALEGGNAEVKLGQLAAQKGNSEDVKQFGQKMVDDHTKLGEQMKQVAQQEGITVPEGIPAKDKALETKLNSLSGEAFDKAYIKAMVQDHRKDLAEFKKEANSGNDTSIKDAASQGSQIISQHLQMAEQIAQKHNIQTGASSATANGTVGQAVGQPGQPQ